VSEALTAFHEALHLYLGQVSMAIFARSTLDNSIVRLSSVIQAAFDQQHQSFPISTDSGVVTEARALVSTAESPAFLRSMDDTFFLADTFSRELLRNAWNELYATAPSTSVDEPGEQPISPMAISPPPIAQVPSWASAPQENRLSSPKTPPTKRPRAGSSTPTTFIPARMPPFSQLDPESMTPLLRPATFPDESRIARTPSGGQVDTSAESSHSSLLSGRPRLAAKSQLKNRLRKRKSQG